MEAVVLEDLQGKQGSDHGTLVIAGSSAVKLSILFGNGERIRIPAFSGRNDIQVSQDTDDLIAFADLAITDIVIQIGGFQTVLFH